MQFQMPFIDLHTHNSSAEENTIKVVNLFPDVSGLSNISKYASIGLHPWYIKDNYIEQLTQLRTTAQNKMIIAIGEAGLDKAVKINFELQKTVFIAQAKIAEELSKPMIIHAVKTYNDVIALRKKITKAPPWIIHGFTGNKNIANELIRNNFCLSFGKDLFNNKSHAPEVFCNSSYDTIFLETDDSGLTIKSIYEKASELLKISTLQLCTQINNNFQKLFQIKL